MVKVKEYLAENLIQVIIAILLLIVSSLAGYFCHKVTANEARIWELEVKNPAFDQRIARLDDQIEEVKADIKDLQAHIDKRFDRQYEQVKDLINRRGR